MQFECFYFITDERRNNTIKKSPFIRKIFFFNLFGFFFNNYFANIGNANYLILLYMYIFYKLCRMIIDNKTKKYQKLKNKKKTLQ